MHRRWNKKILNVLMQWNYCDRRRGPAADRAVWHDNIAKLASSAEVFYYDDYIADLPELRRKVLQRAEALGPDLIFWPSFTDQFDAATLDEMKRRWATAVWFGDDTWRFDDYSSKLSPHITYPLTTDPFCVGKYRRIGVEPILTQWAGQRFGPDRPPLPAGADFKYQVSFVGSRDYSRDWFIWELGKRGIKVECFGGGWPNGRLPDEDMERVFNSSRINLNLSNSVPRDVRCVLRNPKNVLRYLRGRKAAEQVKARNFEIPLAGGFQLSNYAIGLDHYLDIGREVAVFTAPDDCAEQIHYFLANENLRHAVAVAGYTRASREHTYLARLESVFARIWP
ncbi:MAG: glycosyltransferase [Elusimicrobia bacterium]|nr:glycosyltransferase [Elusimicrobiota bacterium]